MEQRMFFGAINTDHEIAQLRLRFASAEPGAVLAHQDIAEAAGIDPGTSRYRTVVERFRKILLVEKNIELVSLRGEGYQVLTASGRLSEGVRRGERIRRAIRGAHYRMMLIPRAELSDAEVRQADHAQMFLAKAADDFATAKKQLSAPSPVTR